MVYVLRPLAVFAEEIHGWCFTEFLIRLCLRRRFPPLGLHRGILNSSYVLILLIHTKHKYKYMKSWTYPMSSFPWIRTHPLGRQGKKGETSSRALAHKSWMVKCFPTPSGILAEVINTKILTKNHPDSLHSHSDCPHSHPESPHSHPNSPHSQSHSPHSYLHSPHSHPDFLHSDPDSPHSPHSQLFQSHSLHSHPDSMHSHPVSWLSHPGSLRSHPDSPRSHHSPHSVPRFPIPAFADSL